MVIIVLHDFYNRKELISMHRIITEIQCYLWYLDVAVSVMELLLQTKININNNKMTDCYIISECILKVMMML